MSDPIAAIRRAAEIAGSQQALANLCELNSQGAIQRWLTSGRVPAHHVLRIERALGVSRHDLRPDLYPREDRP